MPELRSRIIAGAALLLCLGMWQTPANAQDQPYTLTGTVVDANTQAPLPSVTVLLSGTERRTITNSRGVYTLTADIQPGSYTLSFSLLGKGQATRAVSLGTDRAVQVPTVALQESALQLEGLVVTGTGAPTQRRALGNTVATVSAEELTQGEATSVDAALQGKVPGALISSNNGTPGGGVSVRLRGTSSIIGGAEPLYIIDGVIVDNSSDQAINFGYRSNPSNRLADLDPNDVERVEVLKGAAAAALYGSRANNGVVQIFTKRGRIGETRVTAEVRGTLGQLTKHLPFNQSPVDGLGNPVERFDNESPLFRDAFSSETHASVSGGADRTQYYAAGSFTDQQGIMRGSDYRRYNVRLNLDQQLGGWLKLSAGANYINSETNLVINGEQGTGGLLTAVVFTPTTIDLTARDPETGGFLIRQTTFPNPFEVIADWRTPQDISRFVGSFQARATPLANLSLEYRLGYDTYNQKTSLFIPRGTPVNDDGSATSVQRDQYLLNNDLVGSYIFDARDDLQLTTTAGLNYTFSQEENTTAAAGDLTPFTELVRGAIQFSNQNRFETATFGYFAQEQIAWRDRLFLTGAIRWDASSTFGPDERWQIYPKLSASYSLSEESFWQNSSLGSWFDDFRLRAALGYAGNQPPTGSAYARFNLYTGVNSVDRLGLVNLGDAGNPNLKPERQREFEVGFDAGFLAERVGLSFTYYNQFVEDLLLTRPFAPSTGFDGTLDNIGELRNRGIELQLTSRNVERPAFGWNTTFNFSRNRNEVQKLVGDPFTVGYINRVQEGEALGVFRTFDYKRDAGGNIQFDSLGLPLRADTLSIVGDPNPDFQASLGNEFRLGQRLRANLLLDGVFGFQVWNQTRRIMDIFGAGPLSEAEQEGRVPQGFRAATTRIAGAYIEDAGYVKLRELSLTYDMPAEWFGRLGLNSAAVTLSGRNLYTWTDYSGYDPEINMFGTATVARGTDFAVYPNPRLISLGVRVTY